jgi:hypothetical protein
MLDMRKERKSREAQRGSPHGTGCAPLITFFGWALPFGENFQHHRGLLQQALKVQPSVSESIVGSEPTGGGGCTSPPGEGGGSRGLTGKQETVSGVRCWKFEFSNF